MSESTQRPIRLTVRRATAARWIRKEIVAGRELPTGSWVSGKSVADAVHVSNQWLKAVEELLRRIFDMSGIADEWSLLKFEPVNSAADRAHQAHALYRKQAEFIVRLEGVLKRLPYIAEALPGQTASPASAAEGAISQVFIVHGHDEAAKESVARFLMQLEIHPIILAEEPNRGRTIIEKLEASDDVAFAVVLLTPDDLGTAKADAENLKPRARQNVVLELGYFVALLGREGVCALYRDGVEIPSDYHGVVYVALDSEGAWKPKLAQELNAAGIHVDLNKAYKLR